MVAFVTSLGSDQAPDLQYVAFQAHSRNPVYSKVTTCFQSQSQNAQNAFLGLTPSISLCSLLKEI